LLTDSNFLPYGKSIIEPARKVWKQLTLMEDAMLINRIMRAPEKRIFKIDVGNIPPQEVDTYMEKIINQMKKTPYVDQQTGEYNLKFNLQNMLEDYFLPVRGGQSGTEIDTLAGMEFTGIDDIEYLKNRMMSALKVPKAFLGYEEGLSGKATLAAEDVRFARTIEKIQRIVISELHKIAIIHLYSQGYENAELLDFELSMTSPSTIYEQEKLTLYTSKVDLAKSMLEGKIISRDWIFKNIFNFNDDEIDGLEKQIIKDQKDTFRLTKISEEGEDPADPKNQKKKEEEGGEEEGGGNPFESVDMDLQKEYDKRSKNRNTPEVPEGGWPGAGRPEEPIKYNSHDHPRGYDPIGRVAWKNARTTSNESVDLVKKYGLSKLVVDKQSLLSESSSLMDEENILPEEI